jgi:hypothetical protein
MKRPTILPSNGWYSAALCGVLVASVLLGWYAFERLRNDQATNAMLGEHVSDQFRNSAPASPEQLDPLVSADGNVTGRTIRGKPITERDGKLWLLVDSDRRTREMKWLEVTDAAIDPRRFDHGIGLDRIPSIDAPEFGSKDDERWSEKKLPEDARIIGVEFEGEIRAYPIDYMGRHELVNDTFGDTHLTVAY